MARAYQTVEQAAKETQEFSDAIDVQLPEYRAARGDFEELFLAHISYLQVNESERTAAAGVAHSALDLRKQVESTVQSFVGLRNSFKQARGLSRSMNHALSRADNSVEALISEFSLIISFSVRMINLIGDKLAALDAKTLNP